MEKIIKAVKFKSDYLIIEAEILERYTKNNTDYLIAKSKIGVHHVDFCNILDFPETRKDCLSIDLDFNNSKLRIDDIIKYKKVLTKNYKISIGIDYKKNKGQVFVYLDDKLIFKQTDTICIAYIENECRREGIGIIPFEHENYNYRPVGSFY